MKALYKFDRFFAWILFSTMLLFFVSGYGITKGIISNKLAINIHNSILPPVAILTFTVHTWFAIHLAFKRWIIWNLFSKIFLALFFIAFVGYFGYLQYFYQPNFQTNNFNVSKSVSNTSNASEKAASSQSISSGSTSSEKNFTQSELAKYNGKNGQPSYVVVDGLVYDLSSVFVNGTHFGWSAGQDLSAEFHAEHSDNLLSGYPVVGKLE